MSLLADLVVACALTLLTFAALARQRRSHGPWLFSAMLTWAFSLGLMVSAAARGSTTFPALEHCTWVLSIVLAGIGLARLRSGPGTYIGPMLAMDNVMVASTWLLMAWRLFVWEPGLQLGVTAWAMVLVLAVLANGVALALLLYANYPVPKLAMILLGSIAVTAGQVLAAHDAVLARSSDFAPSDQAWRLGLSVVGTALCLGAAVVSRGLSSRETDLLRATRRRGLVVMPLIGLPVAALVIWRPDEPLDQASLALGIVALLCFLGREYVRNVHNTELIERLGELAMLDPLTNIGNRRALADDLPKAVHRSRSVCLLSLDIDRFKEINRQLGHAAGDRVLARLAALLESCGIGTPYRLGGDEFAVLIEGSLQYAISGAEDVRTRCQETFADMADIDSLALTVSIGLAQVHGDQLGDDPLELLVQSNQALRAAKNERNRVRVYSDQDASDQEYRDSIELCLRQALNERQVEFCYQPIVSMRHGAVTSVESLARWRDPVLGVVSPQEFIAVAEESGLIHELGWQSLEAGVAAARRLAQQGVPVTVGVNVSPVQLRRQHFVDDLVALLDAHEVPPYRITVEVTEGIFISLDDPAVEMLYALAKHGVNIAIDDFGSGYSSLGYITRLPASTIKLDRSLTKEVEHPRSRSIIAAVLGVAAAHDLKVVCEGVESAEVAAQLGELGADLIQGWLYSPAVAEDQLRGVIESFAADPKRLALVRRLHTEAP